MLRGSTQSGTTAQRPALLPSCHRLTQVANLVTAWALRFVVANARRASASSSTKRCFSAFLNRNAARRHAANLLYAFCVHFLCNERKICAVAVAVLRSWRCLSRAAWSSQVLREVANVEKRHRFSVRSRRARALDEI